jgi:hypothetical protein
MFEGMINKLNSDKEDKMMIKMMIFLNILAAFIHQTEVFVI